MRKFAFALALLFLGASVAWPQGYDKQRGRAQKEKGFLELQPQRFSFGVGSFFDQESSTFSVDAVFVPIQLHGIEFPGLKEGTSTGVAIEIHPGSLVGKGGVPRQVDYRLWSISRVPISIVPWSKLQSGTPDRVFGIADVLIEEWGTDYTEGFTMRAGFGGDLGVVGPGNLVIEVYMFGSEYRAFGLLYSF